MYRTTDGRILSLSANVNSYPKGTAGATTLQGTQNNDVFHSSARETLLGGLGDDRYELWQPGSVVVEKAGEGIDTVVGRYWGGVTLADNVENLILVSAGATFGTGNRLDNIIFAGDTGAKLDGRQGNDVLVGGRGDDMFIISAGNGSDAVMNFKPGYDTISLQGYGFGLSSWTDLSSRMVQTGADVSIGLAGNETLVLRDVRLGDLDASDFGMRLPTAATPAGHVALEGAWTTKAANGWAILNNAWGATALTEGVDYSLSSHVNPSDMTAGTTFNWAFPINNGPTMDVLAYPEVIFGVSPHGDNVANRVGVFPIQLSNLKSLTADYDVSFSSSNGFNVAFDVWLTSKAYGDTTTITITNEVMIWAHQGNFGSGGKVVGTYSKDGFNATIYHRDGYTALVPDADVPKASIDVADILMTLSKIGIISTDEFVASIEFGAEVSGGSGSLTINNLDLRVSQVDASGAIISHEVTGAGTQEIVPASQNAAILPEQAAAPLMEAVVDAKGHVTGYTMVEDRGTSGVLTSHFDGAQALVGSRLVKAEAAGAVRTTDYEASGVVKASQLDVPQGGGAVRSYYFDAHGALKGSKIFGEEAGGGDKILSFDAAGTFLGAETLSVDSAGISHLTQYGANWKAESRTVTGTDGNDKIYGGGTANVLRGGAGDDTLVGNVAEDTLIGGAGRDMMRGQGGADRFVFERVSEIGNLRGQSDGILDFNSAQGDKIDLSAIDANITLAGHQTFVFTTAKPAMSIAGSLWTEASVESGTWELRGDVDGDGKSDFMINVASGGVPLTVDAIVGATAPVPRKVTIQEPGGAIRTIYYDDKGVVTASELKVAQAGGVVRTSFFDNASKLVRSESADIDSAGSQRVMHYDANNKFQGADTVAFRPDGVKVDTHYGTDWKVQTRLSIGTDASDTIYGGSGSNTIRGGAGNDMLGGATGADVLVGGSGRDTLKGFAGADRFVFDNVGDTGNTRDTADWVLDFSSRDGDKIDLSTIDANMSMAGDQSFLFSAAKPVAATAGNLWLEGTGKSWDLRGDIDGDGKADFMIRIDTLLANGLSAGDLIL